MPRATRYVAFLRGMNLGGRRITNDALCACFEDIGLKDVSAFLASGNVLFTTAKKPKGGLEAYLARELEARLDYPVPTFIRDADEVRAIAAHEPFAPPARGRKVGKLQVAMLVKAPGPAAKRKVLALGTKDDQLAIAGRELYWLPCGNMSASELDLKAIAKTLGAMTIRTRRTIERIAAGKL
jgi:uncharacterized protein (DUF1697 family)